MNNEKTDLLQDLTTEERELAQRLGSLRTLKPSPHYRQMGKARLLMQIAELETSSPAPTPASSPASSPLLPASSSRAGWFQFPRFARYASVALLLLLILCGSGYAIIRKSMPGEHLYAVKIKVERAQIALTPAEQQPVLFIRLTQRRLEELEQVIKSHPNEQQLVMATRAYREAIAESVEKVDKKNTAMAANVLQQQTQIINRLVEQTPPESQEVVKQAQVLNEQARARVIERSHETEAVAAIPITHETSVSGNGSTPSPQATPVLFGEKFSATSIPTDTPGDHSADPISIPPVPTRMPTPVAIGVGAEEPVSNTTRRVSETPVPSPEPTVSASPSQTRSPTPKPSATSTLIPTRLPTHTPVPTNSPTHTPVPTNSPTHTPVPTNSPTHTPVPTNSPTYTPVPTRHPTSTPIPMDTPTQAPIVTKTMEMRQTASMLMETRTPTATMTITPTVTITPTMTRTPVPTIVLTPTLGPAVVRTPELFATSTATVTPGGEIPSSQTPVRQPTDFPLPIQPSPDPTTTPITVTVPATPIAYTPMPFVIPTTGHAQDSEQPLPRQPDETQEALPLPIQVREQGIISDTQADQSSLTPDVENSGGASGGEP